MIKNLLPFLALMLLLSSCGSVPVTGRRQILLVSDQEVLSASLTQYSDFIQTAKLSTDRNRTAQVERVGKNIATSTEEYLKANGLESEIANLNWEFRLVEEDQINAFCMPGGKIVVYTGLLTLIDSDDELAVVVGHEVAHAVAKHANERMSQQIVAQFGAAALDQVMSNKSSILQQAAGTVYGLGAQYGVMLPYSRKHEYEADRMGLIFMAMAGYNPERAVTFWEKMSAAGSGDTPEIMRTHPSDANRISEIQRIMPEVKQYMRNN